MATKIVRLCDVCGDSGSSIEVDMPGVLSGPMDADLCEQHWKELVDPLVTFLLEHGARKTPERKSPTRRWVAPEGYVKPADQTTPCLWCPEVSKNQGYHLTHLRVAHGFTGTGMNDAYGSVCPACNATSKSPGAHVARAHPPFRSIWEPFHDKELRKADPFGVIAAVIERGKAGFPEAKPTRKTTRRPRAGQTEALL